MSVNAIDRFTIAQFEQMARSAYIDEGQIEKLREKGIPKKEAWAVALCDQLASGFMQIAGAWRKPTDQDVFASEQRLKQANETYKREHAFAARLALRKEIADLSRVEATDAEKAAVESLLKEGRNAVAVAADPEAVTKRAEALRDPSSREEAIDDEAPEFRPPAAGPVEFQASERTKIVFDDGSGDASHFLEAGDTFKMDESGNWSVTTAGEATREESFAVVSDATQLLCALEESGLVANVVFLGASSVEIEFRSGRKVRATAEAWDIARRELEAKAAYIPPGVETPGASSAASGGVQASEVSPEPVKTPETASGDAGGGNPAASEAAKIEETASAETPAPR